MPPRPLRALATLPRAAAILLVGALAYSNSFAVPFQFDDRVVLVGDPAITGFHVSPASRRFLGDLSFAVSYRLFGDEPAGYHAVNLAIHLANALLVHWLVRLFWEAPSMRRSRLAGEAPTIALLAALLFVAHPLQTQAVTYVVQRYASLAATFFLLAACCYARSRLTPAWRASTGWYALFLASSAAAFWTKENAFVLPLAIALVELVFFSAPLRRRLLLLSPFLAGAAAAAAWAVHAGVTLERLDAATRVDTDLPRIEYLLTQLRVVATYLRLLLVPLGQNLDHDVTISRSLLDPPVLVALLVHVALLSAGLVAILRASRADASWRFVGFGVLWFYVASLVESSVIPIVDVMFEHRVYLPSAGVFAAAAVLLVRLRGVTGTPAWRAIVAVLLVALSTLTFARNRVWRSDLALWSDAAAKSPNKARPLNNLGVAMFERGDARGAIALYERALRADPGYTKSYFNVAEALQKVGECERAIPQYRIFLGHHPDYPETYRNLAECYQRTGEPELARRMRAAYEVLTARASGEAPPLFFR